MTITMRSSWVPDPTAWRRPSDDTENSSPYFWLEAESAIGGGCRSAELTSRIYPRLCSAVHPSRLLSAYLQRLSLIDTASRGSSRKCPGPSLSKQVSPVPPPLAGGHGRGPGSRRQGLQGDALALLWSITRGSFRISSSRSRFPKTRYSWPVSLLKALRSARNLAEAKFQNARTRALFAGLRPTRWSPWTVSQRRRSASSWLPWPMPWDGRSSKAAPRSWPMPWRIASAQRGRNPDGLDRGLDGRSATGRLLLLRRHTAPAAKYRGTRASPENYRRRLCRFRYGPGVCKVDWALSGPIPGRPKSAGRPAPFIWRLLRRDRRLDPRCP